MALRMRCFLYKIISQRAYRLDVQVGDLAKVLLVGKGPPDRGGIAAFLDGLAASDLNRRHDMGLLNVTRDEVPNAGRFTIANLRRTVADAVSLWRAGKGVEVVHIHSALVPLPTLLRAGVLSAVGRLRRSQVLLQVHSGLVELWTVTPARRLVARVCLTPAHRVIAVSEGSRAALLRVASEDRVLLIQNGIDPSLYGPPQGAHTPPRILFAGLLTARKGVVDLLKASEGLVERDIPHQLLLAGGTPDEGPAAEEEVKAAAGPNVHFLGPQPHERMPDIYRAADIFCLPSWWEAAPLSLLEAMATGLAVVASRVGDIPKIVEDGVSGLLVPPRDPSSLTEALKELCLDPERRTAMGLQARRTVVERFDAASMRADIDSLYQGVASGARSR